jgi:hypothetical protein
VLVRFFVRLAISLAVMLIALIAAIIAVAYFAYGLYLVLLQVFMAPAAAVVTGILVLVAAILLIAVTRVVARPRRRRRRGSVPPLEGYQNAAELGGELGRKLRGLADAHASGGLLAALVAGFAVGVSPKLRDFLKAILEP